MPRKPLTPWLALGVLLLPMVAPSGITMEAAWWWPTQLTWAETQTLTPSDVTDPPFSLNFGSQVAIDGDTLVVSTQFDKYSDDPIACPEIGHHDGCDWVYVFVRMPDGTWVESAKLLPDDAQERDTFGYALAVDDTSGIIVVGNPGVNVQANKVYIFERQSDGSWSQSARINWTNPNERLGAFGTTVAVRGGTVAVPVGFPGQTHLFEKRNDTWERVATLDGASNPLGVALGTNTLVTLIIDRPPGCVEEEGLVSSYKIYDRIEGNWQEVAHLRPSAEHAGESTVGTRFALNEDGDVLVIGVAVDRRVYGVPTELCVKVDGPDPIGPINYHWDDGIAGAVGSAWVYERFDKEWVMTADIPNPTPNPGPSFGGSVFGAAVDASGDRIVVGARGDMYNGGPVSGAVFVYGKTAGDWLLQGKLRNHNAVPGNWFGYSVAISGSIVVSGADLSSPTGTAHVFEPLLEP